MKRKIALVLVSLTLLLSMSVGIVGCSDDESNGENGVEVEVSWDLATYTTEGSTLSNIMDDFAERVKEKSGGKMEINVFHGGTLATGVGIFDGVSDGSIEMGSSPVSYYASKFMLTAMALSPCWAWDTDLGLAARKAIVEEWQPAIDQYADNNMTPILWVADGFVELCFKNAVTTDPDDAEGHAIATYDSSTLAAMATGLGCTTNNADQKDLVTNASGSSPIVTGAFIPVSGYSALGLGNYLPYLVMTQFFPTVYSSIMNVDAFNSLDADMQAAVLEAADEAEEAGIEQAKEDLADLITELQANSDVTLTILNATQQVNWWADMGPQMYGGISAVLNGNAIPGIGSAGYWDEVEAIAEEAMGIDSPFHDM